MIRGFDCVPTASMQVSDLCGSWHVFLQDRGRGRTHSMRIAQNEPQVRAWLGRPNVDRVPLRPTASVIFRVPPNTASPQGAPVGGGPCGTQSGDEGRTPTRSAKLEARTRSQ